MFEDDEQMTFLTAFKHCSMAMVGRWELYNETFSGRDCASRHNRDKALGLVRSLYITRADVLDV